MSLDVYLRTKEVRERKPRILMRENGTIKELTREEWDKRYPGREPVIAELPDMNTNTVFDCNITQIFLSIILEFDTFQIIPTMETHYFTLIFKRFVPEHDLYLRCCLCSCYTPADT